MTLDEIFTKMAERMREGIYFHECAANCYGLLSLPGYKRCHEYHFYSEIHNYRCLYHYVLNHCGKLIKTEVEPHDMLDASLYKHSREEIDTNTKRNWVRELVKKWVAVVIKKKEK